MMVTKRLDECCILEKGNSPIQKTQPGDYPMVVTAEQRKTADSYQFDSATVCIPLVSSRGHGVAALNQLYYQEGKFALGNILCGVTPKNKDELLPKFLYYYLNYAKDWLIVPLMTGGANVSLTVKTLSKVKTVIPPLAIQQEIVSVLDKFTDLISDIDKAIEQRQKQYEYYREKLLTFEEGECEWKKLGEVCRSISSGKCVKKSDFGQYPVYGSTGVIAYTDDYSFCEDNILIARVGANAGFAQIASGFYDVTDNTLIVHLNKDENLKYIYYHLINRGLNQYAKGGGQPLVTGKDMKELKFPFHDVEKQRSIVATLDKFETLISDLKQMRELRQKQYEYYREKLLSFRQEDVKKEPFDIIDECIQAEKRKRTENLMAG